LIKILSPAASFSTKFAAGGRPIMAGEETGRTLLTNSLQITAMRSAIAFGLVIVIFAVLMPDVFHAVSSFLLALFTKATAMVNALPAQPAIMSH
jgi:hypothetical protein